MAKADAKHASGEQQSERPGRQYRMHKKPQTKKTAQRSSGTLEGKVAVISGGDSGIGRAVAVAFAKEGAKIVIGYLEEHVDAEETIRLVEAEGGQCVSLAGDIGDEAYPKNLIALSLSSFGGVDIVVNNAAEQHPTKSILDISAEQLEHTFRTNIFGMFFLTKAALPHLKKGSSIINTTSVTAYRGSPGLLDYSSTKGAIVSFTRSLSGQLAGKGIRVNAVAPGPIWTPLIPSTFPPKKVKNFGKDVPLGRPGQPAEVATAFVFLASENASYVTGQTIHVNGGEIING